MLKIAISTVFAFGIATTAALASEQTSFRDTANALKDPPNEARSDLDQAKARSSIAWGQVFSAANLMEQADAGKRTVMTRFNLATAYERTGRLDEAAMLYRGLLRDGQYTTAVLDPDESDPDLAPRRVNVADESAARLAVLDRLAAQRMAATGQVFSAEQAGANAAAVEGAPRTGALSDDRALALDAAAMAARNGRR